MNVGLRTIQRMLVEEDRKCYRPLRGMVLTKTHKEKRLSWANIHLELNFNDFWSQVCLIKFFQFLPKIFLETFVARSFSQTRQ